MISPKPEAHLKLRLKTTQEGGRQGPVFGDHYGCPIRVDGHFYDCRLLLHGRKLELGHVYSVPVVFLSPECVLPLLKPGKEVELWEGKTIGEGTVVISS